MSLQEIVPVIHSRFGLDAQPSQPVATATCDKCLCVVWPEIEKEQLQVTMRRRKKKTKHNQQHVFIKDGTSSSEWSKIVTHRRLALPSMHHL